MVESYRDYANDIITYQAEMRDAYVLLNGIVVSAQIPNTENATDLYSDFDSSSVEVVEIPVIPMFDKYYLMLSTIGDDMEETVPLEVIVRVGDFIPQNTIIPLLSRSQNGVVRERKWRVLSTEIKHLENYYTKIAHCVPLRMNTNS